MQEKNTISEIVDKWTSSKLLDGIINSHVKRNVAVLLDNQILMNKLQTCEIPHHFLRCSSLIVRRSFDESFLGNQLVSIQPSLGPHFFIINFKLNQMYSQSLFALTKMLPFNFNNLVCDPKTNVTFYKGCIFHTMLDAEVEMAIDFSRKYSQYMTLEIVNDLTNNVKIYKDSIYQNEHQLFYFLQATSSAIGDKCGREANWIVMSPMVVRLLANRIKACVDDIDADRIGINQIGILDNKWKIFENSNFNEKILLGFKDDVDPYHSGYVYCPYIPLSFIKKDNFNENFIFCTRYGKRLIDADFYGLINMKNLPTEIEG